jgi:predicted ATPase
MQTNLEYIKIANFRSITDTDIVKIMPITILVGKNSAGKSTFARSFPLIRQSTETKKRAPILWFGDRVDFGSFDESLSRNAQNKKIEFTFGLRMNDDVNLPIKKNRRRTPRDLKAQVTLEIGKKSDGSSYASFVEIQAFGYEVSLNLSDDGGLENLKIDSERWESNSEQKATVSYGAVLPTFTFLRKVNFKGPDGKAMEGYVHNYPFDSIIASTFDQEKISKWKPVIIGILQRAPLLFKGDLVSHVEDNMFFELDEIPKLNWNMIRRRLMKIEHLVFASKISLLSEQVNSGLREFYKNVKYIEPLRATAQRYYRKQELAIDEIDAKGENLAMFLDNLSSAQLRNFNEWTRARFGFSASTRKYGGHVEIVINEGDSTHTANLADIGFGFSQILPVIVQIWYSTLAGGGRDRKRNTIVIEQPELHLHPAFQAKLADVFASTIAAKRGAETCFIIETHSNHIVNRIGQLISKGELTKDSVQILVFDKNENSETVIQRSGFDDEGYLINWPYGFFEPEF